MLVEATAPAGDAPPPLAELIAKAGLAENATVAATEAQAGAFWRLRESVSEAERADGVAAKHDVAVPVSAMPRFMVEARAKVEVRFIGSRVLAFGHLGDGNVHFNVRAPELADDRAWFARNGAEVSAFVHDLVTAEGGTISAEHGIGRLKRDEFLRLADPAVLAAQRAIKRALDPHGLMNPGALLPLAVDDDGP